MVVTTEAVLLPASSQAESAPAAPRKMSWRPRARTQSAEPEQDAATCACWLSNSGDSFAVGFTSGVVRLYSIPDAALGMVHSSYTQSLMLLRNHEHSLQDGTTRRWPTLLMALPT